jgi:signal transduction histidine kinase
MQNQCSNAEYNDLARHNQPPGSECSGESSQRSTCTGQAHCREVAALKRRLAESARQANMVELASTALHNVSNVLNNVNVSSLMIAQRLRESRVDNVGKAVSLIRTHVEDLGRFFCEDPKGKLLPGYLETLAEHLMSERRELLREVEVLTRSIEHMKEIVTVQQDYARKCGVREILSATELVEDALRMNSGAFERHRVAIVREFEETPPITADKHKVLQILVNLIRNAKYALDEQGAEHKRLTLEVRATSNKTVAISVRDNGIGIARENLGRIFEHGFTTKRDGHGFGLHSGLTATTEMGGTLSAQSEGLGKGATFRLELPITLTSTAIKDHAG